MDAVSYSLAALGLLGEECTRTFVGFCGLWELSPKYMSCDQNKPEGLATPTALQGPLRTKGGLRVSEKPLGESFPKHV